MFFCGYDVVEGQFTPLARLLQYTEICETREIQLSHIITSEKNVQLKRMFGMFSYMPAHLTCIIVGLLYEDWGNLKQFYVTYAS